MNTLNKMSSQDALLGTPLFSIRCASSQSGSLACSMITLDNCQAFLLQCQLVYQQQPLSISTKRNYIISLQQGRALTLVKA